MCYADGAPSTDSDSCMYCNLLIDSNLLPQTCHPSIHHVHAVTTEQFPSLNLHSLDHRLLIHLDQPENQDLLLLRNEHHVTINSILKRIFMFFFFSISALEFHGRVIALY